MAPPPPASASAPVAVAAAAEAAKEKDKKPKKPPEYNPRWKGYCFILIASLVNFSAITSIPNQNTNFEGVWGLCVSFGSFTFLFSVLVLFFDRTQLGVESFNYTKARDANFEGFSLLFLTLWWIIGVSYITQVNGIAYLATNIYFSAWLTLVSCIYTLNKWSSAKDILTIAELTGVSATLKSWYVLFLSSIVVLGTSLDIYLYLVEESSRTDATLALALGLVSSVLSFGWILAHYNFIEFCNEGGWIEFGTACLLIIMWIVGASVLTSDDGIASTINGSGCQSDRTQGSFSFSTYKATSLENCTIIFQKTDGTEQIYSCLNAFEDDIPGSNLYVATWVCLLSSLNLALRWKAQQALQFAQARNRKASTEKATAMGEGDGDGDDFDASNRDSGDDEGDDDGDDDDFEDANY
jgi:hypothetical protein